MDKTLYAQLNDMINNDHDMNIDAMYILDQLDSDELVNNDALLEVLLEAVLERQVTYYSSAIKYLAEHDASLQDSLELAQGLGYDTKDLDSELLATIHLQNAEQAKLDDLVSDIVEIVEAHYDAESEKED